MQGGLLSKSLLLSSPLLSSPLFSSPIPSPHLPSSPIPYPPLPSPPPSFLLSLSLSMSLIPPSAHRSKSPSPQSTSCTQEKKAGSGVRAERTLVACNSRYGRLSLSTSLPNLTQNLSLSMLRGWKPLRAQLDTTISAWLPCPSQNKHFSQDSGSLLSSFARVPGTE